MNAPAINPTDTAAVATRTAEMVTLVVDRLQVTLEAYRQLDTEPYPAVEPLGRVRDPQDDVDWQVWIVGRAHHDGGLVRACLERPTWHTPAPTSAFDHWAFHRNHDTNPVPVGESTAGMSLTWMPQAFDCREPTFDEPVPEPWSMEADADWKRRAREHHTKWVDGGLCDMDALYARWTAHAAQALVTAVEAQSRFDAARALPLIVLGGLR